MTTTTFVTLPTEIQVSIAELCNNNDLINLCLTSKLVNERCLPVLYRHVDLQFDPSGLGIRSYEDFLQKMADLRMRQQIFGYTLLSHPEYGKHVRSLEGMLCIPRSDDCKDLGGKVISDEDFWRALLSLTVIQCVEICSSDFFSNNCMSVPGEQLRSNLFQSATSVRLVGHMHYRLAKSILDAINPATLKHLCLDMVQDRRNGQRNGGFAPGDIGEDGRIVALGVISGLLIKLTGRCTALQTLILRRRGHQIVGWHKAAEEASYIEWASFIHSVKGTVEKFMFEQAGAVILCTPRLLGGTPYPDWIIMDDAFRRLILPAIVSGSWPCMTYMELGGVGRSMDRDGRAALKTELMAVLGVNTEIVVKESVRAVSPIRKIFGWN